MTPLNQAQCQACRADAKAVAEQEMPALLAQLDGWRVESPHGVLQLERTYQFKNFRQAMAFSVAVGEAAEAQQHHPALLTEWGKVRVSWWTHAINGLHLNDFIMAARSDELYKAAERQ